MWISSNARSIVLQVRQKGGANYNPKCRQRGRRQLHRKLHNFHGTAVGGAPVPGGHRSGFTGRFGLIFRENYEDLGSRVEQHLKESISRRSFSHI